MQLLLGRASSAPALLSPTAQAAFVCVKQFIHDILAGGYVSAIKVVGHAQKEIVLRQLHRSAHVLRTGLAL